MIVVSSYLKNFYRKKKHVVRIPIIANIEDKKWKSGGKKASDKLYLVYAGNARKKDRIDFLVEALMCVKRPYQLDVIGMTEDEYIAYYSNHKEWVKNCKDIIFHGRLTHEDTVDYIKKANYSCFFRINDRISKAGFPTKFVESICCGTPVITNETSDLSYYIKEGENGILISNLGREEIKHAIENAPVEMSTNPNFADMERYEGVIDEVFSL